jgi:glycosyltransferase involved in cell wall biosynthesis
MKIVYLGTREQPLLSGGMISILLTVDALCRAGHEARVVAPIPAPSWAPVDVPWFVSSNWRRELRDCDAVVTGWRGVGPALAEGVEVVALLCAGYDKLLWPTLADEIETAYRRPPVRLVVSPHLQGTLREDLGVDSHFIGTALVSDWFRAAAGNRDDHGQPARVLVVGSDPTGPYAPVPFKGIATSLEVAARVKNGGVRFDLVRMTPRPDDLVDSPLVDEAHVAVSPVEAPNVYGSCDIYLSASTEAEGLGKPAVEAALAGNALILPEISSYRGIDELREVALFYPPGDLDAATEHLERLLADRTTRARLQDVGRSLQLEDRFSPGAVAARTARALKSARR